MNKHKAIVWKSRKVGAEKRKPGSQQRDGSGEADPLVSEMRRLATTEYPLCPEARLLLEMAVECQQGKPIDVNRLLPNAGAEPPAN